MLQIASAARSLMYSKNALDQEWSLEKHNSQQYIPLKNYHQELLKSSTAVTWQNKIKHPTWNSRRLMVVKKICIPDFVKCCGCYSSDSLRIIKSPSNSIRYNCHEIYSRTKRFKNHTGNLKKVTFQGDPQVYYLQVFQGLS